MVQACCGRAHSCPLLQLSLVQLSIACFITVISSSPHAACSRGACKTHTYISAGIGWADKRRVSCLARSHWNGNCYK